MNRSGRIIGMAVFVVGIIVLLFVFGIAYATFTSPASELLRSGGAAGAPLTGAGLGSAAVLVLVRIALLFVMTLAGSLIAGRGIQLYLGSGETSSPETSKSAPREPDSPAESSE